MGELVGRAGVLDDTALVVFRRLAEPGPASSMRTV
jgi:hypothetical protein